MDKKITGHKVTRSQGHQLFAEAKKYLVGGVNSPVRSFRYVGGDPVLIKSGRGAKVFDYDNKEYIDYVLSWGALILGHAYSPVIKALRSKIASGLSFGTTNKDEIELAALISKAIPFAQKIRFTNSGTEAVMGAVRLARGFTKRDKIVKFNNSYHGAADYLLAKGGSGLATLGIPSSSGVPKDFTRHTLVLPFGDESAIEELFKHHGREIAAVLVEPVGGNYGVLPANINFLKKLRALTKRYTSLLIFDEIITGFRFRFGSIAQEFGIEPDLICLGKIIGGGLPIGAYAGKTNIMEHLAPLGDVYQASTFSGNPVVMQAGLATLIALKKLNKEYSVLNALTEYLTGNIIRQAQVHNLDLEVARFGSMFSFKFKDKELFVRFYRRLLERGIYFAPSEFEANFLSFAHKKTDIDKTISALGAVFTKLKEK